MKRSSPLPEPLLEFDAAPSAIAEVLARIDDLKLRYCTARDAGRVLQNVVEALRIELTYHSNAIEGSTLSLRDTQLVIEGLAPSGSKSMRELYEARNHDRALRTIETWATQRPVSTPITEHDLSAVQAMVLTDIDLANAGRFRSQRVLITGTRFVPPGSHKFGELIPAMLELANRPGVHPALQAAELHYNIVAIHPFGDGIGRTARLLMNYLLLRQGFPHAIINVAQRDEYLRALDEANAGKWERFAVFVCTSIARSIQKLIGDAEGDDD